MSDDVVRLSGDAPPFPLGGRGGGALGPIAVGLGFPQGAFGPTAVGHLHGEREGREQRHRQEQLYEDEVLVGAAGRHELVGAAGHRSPVGRERHADAGEGHRAPTPARARPT